MPASWIWAHLSQVADVIDPNPSHRMPSYVLDRGQPLISSENFTENDSIDFSIGKRVQQETVQDQIERFSIADGAFGFSRIGTIGKTRPLPTKRNYAISHAVCVVNPLAIAEISMSYLRMAVSVDEILAHAHGGTRSIGVPDLGLGVMRTMPIPLPPLAEQHRIVRKVDTLIELCEKLKTATTTGHSTKARLFEVLLNDSLAQDEHNREAA